MKDDREDERGLIAAINKMTLGGNSRKVGLSD